MIIAAFIVVGFAVAIVLMLCDVDDLIGEVQHEEQLDQLWGDDEVSA